MTMDEMTNVGITNKPLRVLRGTKVMIPAGSQLPADL